MNDPGLEDAIATRADQVESRFDDEADQMAEEGDDQAFAMPARWWYASTGFPLLAGTLGPMANTFSVCALVQYWRTEIPAGGTEAHGIDIKDPKWVTAVNVISLAFALSANMSLLLNMARRLPFRIAQPITILGFWMASVLLIILIALASNNFKAPDVENQALTQAYYYAIFAAVLYQIISYLMCVTVWGAYHGHYSQEFKLTMSQRTLMLQTITFMVYLLAGAGIYSRIEGWEFLDAIYWADFTCLTVGIGDYAPTTELGRGLLFPYALGGIVALGLVVGSIRSMILDRGKQKLHARMTEKTRKSVLLKMSRNREKSNKSETYVLDPQIDHALALNPSDSRDAEKERRRAEFEAMRVVQELAATKRKWISLAISGGVFIFLWLVGALVFFRAETNQDFTYFSSLYFAYTSLLTIGYGDIFPMSNSGKPFFVVWSLLAVPSLTILISDMGDTVVKVIKDLTIYLGEVTILPSDEGSVVDRLKYGIAKITPDGLGKQAYTKARIQEKVKLPGMVNMRSRKVQQGLKQPDVETAQLKTDEQKKADGKDGPEWTKGFPPVQGHEYRYVLMAEIKKVYAHINASPPKEFTYDEWSFYLRLLGQDEHDRQYHRRAPVKDPHGESAAQPGHSPSSPPSADAGQVAGDSDQEHGGAKGRSLVKAGKHNTEWSWLGNRSPLMDALDEAEWILKRLFNMLERDLKKQMDQERLRLDKDDGVDKPDPTKDDGHAQEDKKSVTE